MRRALLQLLRIPLVLLLGALLGATLVRLAPGYGADEDDLNSALSAESRQALRDARSADAPLGSFYLQYCRRLMHGDLGFASSLQEPVRQLLADRIPVTAASMAAGLALAWALGLLLSFASVLPATRVLGWAGWLAAGVAICIPAAVLAVGCVLAELPGRLAIGLIVFPKVYQFTRNLLLRGAALPHVLAARARGLSELRVLSRHIVPVAAPQLLALFGVSLCMAFAASIPVEALCDIPGIGQLAWKAALGRDLTLLVDLTMIVTVITLLANSGADLAAHMLKGDRA